MKWMQLLIIVKIWFRYKYVETCETLSLIKYISKYSEQIMKIANVVLYLSFLMLCKNVWVYMYTCVYMYAHVCLNVCNSCVHMHIRTLVKAFFWSRHLLIPQYVDSFFLVFCLVWPRNPISMLT